MKACIRMFIAAISVIAQNWKLPVCLSTGEWLTQRCESRPRSTNRQKKGMNHWKSQQLGWILRAILSEKAKCRRSILHNSIYTTLLKELEL